jgi:uncharacterized protein YejL (UPF0352 family)
MNIFQPNLILNVQAELARDILQDLFAVLRRYRAEMFYLAASRAVVMMVGDRSKEVGGKYRVAALLKRIAAARTEYLKGAMYEQDAVLHPNTIRPADHAQVEDIIKSMLEVLAKHCAQLEFDPARKGMVLSQGGVQHEIALVYNITRFGAELEKGMWRFDTELPRFELSVKADAARLSAEMERLRGRK